MPTLNIGIFAIYICIGLCNFKLIDKPAHLIVRFLFRFVKSICLYHQKIFQKYLSNSTTISKTLQCCLVQPALKQWQPLQKNQQESPLSRLVCYYISLFFFLTLQHLQRHCLFFKNGSMTCGLWLQDHSCWTIAISVFVGIFVNFESESTSRLVSRWCNKHSKNKDEAIELLLPLPLIKLIKRSALYKL